MGIDSIPRRRRQYPGHAQCTLRGAHSTTGLSFHFLFLLETHITLSKPHPLRPNVRPALAGKSNGDIRSTDNCYPLPLFLEIEAAIQVDAKWDLRDRRNTSHILPWPERFSGAQAEKVKDGIDVQTTLDISLNGGGGTEVIPLRHKVPTTALRDHFSHPIHNQGTALRPSRQRSTRCCNGRPV